MKKLTSLQRRVYRQVINELKKRIVERPKPTKEEFFLGSYLEMLEPQVRKAVRDLNRKGYTTSSSGFYGKKQVIDGFFKITTKTKADLNNFEVCVFEEKNGYTTVEFEPKQQSFNSIKDRWNTIVNLFPKKQPSKPSDNIGSTLFRKNPLREAFYIIGELEYRLEADL